MQIYINDFEILKTIIKFSQVSATRLIKNGSLILSCPLTLAIPLVNVHIKNYGINLKTDFTIKVL